MNVKKGKKNIEINENCKVYIADYKAI